MNISTGLQHKMFQSTKCMSYESTKYTSYKFVLIQRNEIIKIDYRKGLKKLRLVKKKVDIGFRIIMVWIYLRNKMEFSIYKCSRQIQ